MLLTACADGTFTAGRGRMRCCLGSGGVVEAALKREGDGATPLGVWPIRRLLYRPDRVVAPATALPAAALVETDGWCDDPHDVAYNRPVRLPYAARCERMWREDALYDLVCVLGHNDDPPQPGLGSAIFLHCAAPDFTPTQGCVALAGDDLEAVLRSLAPGSALRICR